MPFAWTAEASWQPYAGTPFFGEEAPQQLPMVDAVDQREMMTNIEIESHMYDPSAHDTVSHCQEEEEVPMQIQMDSEKSVVLQPQAKSASNGVSTLRRRK